MTHAALIPTRMTLQVATFTLCGRPSDDSMIGRPYGALPPFAPDAPGVCGNCARSALSRSTRREIERGAAVRAVGLMAR